MTQGAATWGAVRAAGGLLGVVGGEAWRGARGGFEHDGPVSAALVDLCRAYAAAADRDPPVVTVARHEGVPGLAWLLPVAFVRRDPALRERDVGVLAAAAGVAGDALPACTSYVELAAQLFEAPPPCATVRSVAGTRPVPALSGVGPADGLAVAAWALEQPGDMPTVLARLVEWDEQPAVPWVVAAAGGLLGVRDGCAALPAHWHRRLRSRQRQACHTLGQDLGQVPTEGVLVG